MVLGISARDIVKAASDPRAQTLVATAAQAYAPEQTAKVTAATRQALQHYRQARAILRQPQRPGVPLPPMMPMPPPVDDDGMPRSAPVQKSNILTFAIIGGAALVVLLMLRK